MTGFCYYHYWFAGKRLLIVLFCRALGFLGIKLLRRPCRHLPLQEGCVILKVTTDCSRTGGTQATKIREKKL